MMSDTEPNLQDMLRPMTRVLREMEGQFCFRDETGAEFVLLSRDYLDTLRGEREANESQLSFESMARERTRVDEDESSLAIEEMYEEGVGENDAGEPGEVEDDLALIDEADYPEAQESAEALVEEGEEMVFTSNRGRPSPPPVRVRFEPLEGDLPPQLQE